LFGATRNGGQGQTLRETRRVDARNMERQGNSTSDENEAKGGVGGEKD
jgi:hypothetical protein